MKNIRPLLVLAASFLMSACQAEFIGQHLQPQEVGFYAGGSGRGRGRAKAGAGLRHDHESVRSAWATNI